MNGSRKDKENRTRREDEKGKRKKMYMRTEKNRKGKLGGRASRGEKEVQKEQKRRIFLTKQRKNTSTCALHRYLATHPSHR